MKNHLRRRPSMSFWMTSKEINRFNLLSWTRLKLSWSSSLRSLSLEDTTDTDSPACLTRSQNNNSIWPLFLGKANKIWGMRELLNNTTHDLIYKHSTFSAYHVSRKGDFTCSGSCSPSLEQPNKTAIRVTRFSVSPSSLSSKKHFMIPFINCHLRSWCTVLTMIP